jgi:hypothetical protein
MMTGAWLLANDLKQISDCTGGRIGDAVRYCQSEQIIRIRFIRSISQCQLHHKD